MKGKLDEFYVLANISFISMFEFTNNKYLSMNNLSQNEKKNFCSSCKNLLENSSHHHLWDAHAQKLSHYIYEKFVNSNSTFLILFNQKQFMPKKKVYFYKVAISSSINFLYFNYNFLMLHQNFCFKTNLSSKSRSINS